MEGKLTEKARASKRNPNAREVIRQMKTVNNIFDSIASKENILIAIQRAARGKRKKWIVRYTLKHADEIADKLSDELQSGSWRPNEIHRVKVINDGIQMKKREIVCPDFINEQVVHHAIMNVCGPIFQKRFYRYSCASVPGRGVEFAIKYIRKSLKDHKNAKYFSVIDIKQFFNSIKPSKVFHAIRRIIRDKRVLVLFARILRANKITRPDGEIIKRGTPIGLYTSPWFANLLLTALDNLIKASGVKYYIRYNDDMLLFHSNKRKLKKILVTVKGYINSLGLRLKRPYQIHALSKVKLNYIGATISREKIVLKDKVFLRARRTAARIAKKDKITTYDAHKMLSYGGRFSHFDTYQAFQKYISSKINMKLMRVIVSKGDKKHVHKKSEQNKTTGS